LFSFFGNSPKLLNVAAWQLLNQLGRKILLRFPFVMGWRETGFDCLDIWHSPGKSAGREFTLQATS
jgi:hypothetical protein